MNDSADHVYSRVVEVEAWTTGVHDGGGGWYYTYQSYDWKGRPLVTTNTDGTQKSASYSACGCAGSEVTTLTDEMGRRQKIYSDPLGRTAKTEILNTDGSVYSTASNTYNARDQVTLLRQYQGADTSTTYQDTTMTYDGYGRLQARHAPEQNAGTATTYSYNNDDTILSVTDARGASATYTYNYRHLVTGISYAGAGITATPNVSFGYDSAGNRTSMMDGFGVKTYSYNELSQLISETRAFANVGTYTIGYDYNLAGELKRITDPSGAYTDYSFDSAGRLSAITGAGLGTSQFVSSMQYRAWGTLKSVAYGNGTTASFNYNPRGLPTHYSISGVRESSNAPLEPQGGDFQYYADGQIKFVNDLRTDATANGLHDRAYAYDQIGRIKEAYSGYEARDFLNGTNSGIQDGAFRQSYSYDPWNNLTTRTGRFWSENDSSTDSFNNQNRNPLWDYDADGRLLSNNEPAPDNLPYQPLRFAFDSSGQRVQSTQTSSRQMISQVVLTTTQTKAESYDGDGVLTEVSHTSQTNNNAPYTTSTFYLRSSLFGGAIAEYDSNGVKKNEYVFAGRDVLAQQRRLSDTQSQMLWQHLNPVTGDGLRTDSQGLAIYRTTIDPMATDVGDSDPFADYGGGGGDTGEGISQSAIDSLVASLVPGWGGPRCAIDGMVTGCRLAFGALSSGAAVLGPSQTTVGVYSRSLQRYIGLATWNPAQAAAGVSVFGLPAGWSIYGMNFTGNGFSFSSAFPMADITKIYANLGSQYQGLGNWMGEIVHSGFGTLGQIAEAAYPFGGAPQNPSHFTQEEVDSLRDRLESTLQGGCKKFTDAFLDQIYGSKDHPSILDTFNRVANSSKGGLYHYWGGIGYSTGDVKNGTAQVGLNPNIGINVLALFMIHESVHHMGFGHDSMGTVAYSVATAQGFVDSLKNTSTPGPPRPAGGNQKDNFYNAGIFDNLLNAACGPTKSGGTKK